MLRLKWVGNTTRQLTPKREPQVGRGLFGFHLLILLFKFQYSKSIKSSTFHIFLNLTYPFRKKTSLSQNAPKSPQNLHNHEWNKQRDLALLETWPRYRQKGRVKRRQNCQPSRVPRRFVPLACLLACLNILAKKRETLTKTSMNVI